MAKSGQAGKPDVLTRAVQLISESIPIAGVSDDPAYGAPDPVAPVDVSVTNKDDDKKGGGKPRGASAELAAADLFFADPSLSSDDDDTDPLATQAAEELALMLVE
jgi:hypothetical protein